MKNAFDGGPGREEVPTKMGCEVAVPLGVTNIVTDGVGDTLLPVSGVARSGGAEHGMNEYTQSLSLDMCVAEDISYSVTKTETIKT